MIVAALLALAFGHANARGVVTLEDAYSLKSHSLEGRAAVVDAMQKMTAFFDQHLRRQEH